MVFPTSILPNRSAGASYDQLRFLGKSDVTLFWGHNIYRDFDS